MPPLPIKVQPLTKRKAWSAFALELDGGIDETTAPLGVTAGADALVAGSSIFGASQGIETAMRWLSEATK